MSGTFNQTSGVFMQINMSLQPFQDFLFFISLPPNQYKITKNLNFWQTPTQNLYADQEGGNGNSVTNRLWKDKGK